MNSMDPPYRLYERLCLCVCVSLVLVSAGAADIRPSDDSKLADSSDSFSLDDAIRVLSYVLGEPTDESRSEYDVNQTGRPGSLGNQTGSNQSFGNQTSYSFGNNSDELTEEAVQIALDKFEEGQEDVYSDEMERIDRNKRKADKLKDLVEDKVDDFSELVRRINTQLTDEIDNVPPLVGPPGTAGLDGADGQNGTEGRTGAPGAPGPEGSVGHVGQPGPVGTEGDRGPPGKLGMVGDRGPSAHNGGGGPPGTKGPEGITDRWDPSTRWTSMWGPTIASLESFKKGNYFCPASATRTMRLVDCSTRGCRLEVFFEKEWGSVCSSSFADASASSLCRALGFESGGEARHNLGGGTGQIWLDSVNCSGQAQDIGDCFHSTWGENECEHGMDLGLCCYGSQPTVARTERVSMSEFPRCPGGNSQNIRLNDCNREVCRLEVLRDNVWGTVCDDGFTNQDANIVCGLIGFAEGGTFRQLCAAVGKNAACKANDGGTGPIWLDDLSCAGYERDLEGCRHQPWGKHDCSHTNDVGICCHGAQTNVTEPGPCSDGTLEYDLLGDLESSTGGPPLAAPYGGRIDRHGFHFSEGQGLGVDPFGCIQSTEYSIYLRVSLADTEGWRCLLHSNGWDNEGLFVNSKLMVSPQDTDIVCQDRIYPNTWYQIVMTKNSSGQVSLYLNGALCASGNVESPLLDLNPHQMMFLAEPGSMNGKGSVTKAIVYNRILSQQEVAEVCSCHIIEKDPTIPCQISQVLNVRAKARSHSNIFPGFKATDGMLYSKKAWRAMNAKPGNWIQMDIGSIQGVTGVVTQGRHDLSEWVTRYKVMVSTDGSDWVDISCGKIFEGNYDRNTDVTNYFMYPVRARFVRIYPIEWDGFRASMRSAVLVCERPCVDGQLDYTFASGFMSDSGGPSIQAPWGAGDFLESKAAHGTVYNLAAGQGLQLDPLRCLHGSSSWTILMKARFDLVDGFRKILGTPSWDDYGLYVHNKFLMLTPKSSHFRCIEPIRPNKFYRILLTRDTSGHVALYLNGAVCYQGYPHHKDYYQISPNQVVFMYDQNTKENTGGDIAEIRIWSRALNSSEVEETCNCQQPAISDSCPDTIYFIPPAMNTLYSSVKNHDKPGTGFGNGRLNSATCWSPKVNAVGQYMQIDLGGLQTVTGIVTQGRRNADEWVLSFTVKTSEDGTSWSDVGCGIEFDANVDRNSKRVNLFPDPVKTRYIRISPQSWKASIAMRVAAITCEKPCSGGLLDYGFGNSLTSSTGGPPLDPSWGDGNFEGEGLYAFSPGQGFSLDASRCFDGSTSFTIVLQVQFQSVQSSSMPLVTSASWGEGGLYVDQSLRILPEGANMACEGQQILPGTWYQLGMSRSDDGDLTLFLNGAECAHGMPPFFDHYALNTKDIQLLRDESGRNDPAGTIARIRIWSEALSRKEVAAACGCNLPPEMKPCLQVNEYIPMGSALKYSSLQGSPGLGEGQLNSLQAWLPATSAQGEWLQIDTGLVQTIAGIVTQGRRDQNTWVTAVSVKTSSDGSAWQDVQCLNQFPANSDQNSKVRNLFKRSIRARYVRIYPVSWRGSIAMRAGVLICQSPCLGGQLLYNLDQGTLLSASQGPALDLPWGAGVLGQQGYRFSAGQGLQLDQNDDGCMNNHVQNPPTPNSEYTILMRVSFDDTSDGYYRLISSPGWGDSGLYVNRVLRIFPSGASMKCFERIVAQKLYWFAMSRDSRGKVKLYINGFKCAEGRPSYARGFTLDPHAIDFFHDDGDENPTGYVKTIHVWDEALSDEKIASNCGCVLLKTFKQCERQVILNPQNSQVTFSSVKAQYNQVRLNSPQGWSPANNQIGEYVQIDTGDVQSISGLVVQGHHSIHQWITSLTVTVSDDKLSWTPLFCGAVFDANQDTDTKKQVLFPAMVKARYVRIIPQQWQGGIGMRVGIMLCEKPCVNGLLDYNVGESQSFLSSSGGSSLEPMWGEGNFDAATASYRFSAGQGLALDCSRCLSNPSAWTVLVKVSLDSTTGWQQILGSGAWGSNGLYVNNQLQLYPVGAKMVCDGIILPGRVYSFVMSRDESSNVRLYVNGFPCAAGSPPFVDAYTPDLESMIFLRSEDGWDSGGNLQDVKVWDLTLSDNQVLSACECELNPQAASCKMTVILNPLTTQLSFSSIQGGQTAAPSTGRLGSSIAWSPATKGQSEWIQIDAGYAQAVLGIVTQGDDASKWVSGLSVSVSTDGIKWYAVNCGQIFVGNSDVSTRVKILFGTPAQARYVRIFPQTFQSYPAMRVGLVLCQKPCKNLQLDYRLMDELSSTTDGPALETPWGYNSFTANLGYRFYNGRGLSLNEGNCFDVNGVWTIYLEVRLDDPNRLNALIGSRSWSEGGIYISKGTFTLLPEGASVRCSEMIQSNVFYKYMVSRSQTGDISLYLNGYRCATGSPPYFSGYAIDTEEINFFNADQAAGYVSSIKVWGRELTLSEAATLAGCVLQPQEEACSTAVAYSPPDSSYQYSSVFNNDAIGSGYGRGRLNSPQAWSASTADLNQYLQIDTGKVQLIQGVVTQGRTEYWQYVSSYAVSFSVDGKSWQNVQCGESFPGNQDLHTKVNALFDSPVKARYIRIFPRTWVNWISMRAGVLVCPSQCTDGKLDYGFQNSLLSKSDGAVLIPSGGEGDFADGLGYRFASQQGLNLNVSGCISPFEYTILMEVRLDYVDQWVRLLGAEAWQDYGLYVKDRKFMLFPRSSKVFCHGVVLPNVFYNFGITRQASGEIALYLNGYACAQGSPPFAHHFALDPEDLEFFKADGSDNSAGYVSRISLWSESLSQEKIAGINNCVLAPEAGKCGRTITFNPSYSQMSFSSVWNNNPVGVGHGQGQLDSPQAWSAGSQQAGEYMQIDTGSVQSLAGIVTQMRGDWVWQYVSTYTVSVSNDAVTWSNVQCGAPFQGNEPQSWNDKDVRLNNLFDRPVQGRYVRIIVNTWGGHPSMRAGVLLCETMCTANSLDYRLQYNYLSSTGGPTIKPLGAVGSFGPTGYRYADNAGLIVDASSCLSSTQTYTIIVTASMDYAPTFNRILNSAGWNRYGIFVNANKYQVIPVDMGIACPGYIQNARSYNFGITRDAGGTLSLFLNGWKCAEGDVTDAVKGLELTLNDVEFFQDPFNMDYYGYASRIRIWGNTMTDTQMLSLNSCVVPSSVTPCSSVALKAIPYDSMTFDAVLGNYAAGTGYAQGQLNSPMGWISPDYNVGHWIQLDTGSVQTVMGVATQGITWGWFTTTFSVQVSTDGKSWLPIECGRSFVGNTDYQTVLQNLFDVPVLARYVRIFPETFVGYGSMRAGVITCEKQCQNGLLDYQFTRTFDSSTDGPSLQTTSIGYFDDNYGYRFSGGQILQLHAVNCLNNPQTYSAIIFARFDSVYGKQPLLTLSDWGNDGMAVDVQYTLSPAGISCAEPILTSYYYQFGITRSVDGLVTLYLNGYPCATGRPTVKGGFLLDVSDSNPLQLLGGNSNGWMKRIRLWNKALSAADMASQSGCTLLTEKLPCHGTVVVAIGFDSMSASSVWGNYQMGQGWAQSQLNSPLAWISGSWDQNQWIQLDTGGIKDIAGVVTQGIAPCGSYNWFVSAYWIQLSKDGSTWRYAECGRIFTGNTDCWNDKINLFAKPVTARYVRIIPQSWNGGPALRSGIIVCESQCANQELNYQLSSDLTSSTGGPSLKPAWGQGTFDVNMGYRFQTGFGLQVDPSACLNSSSSAYSLLMQVRLDVVTGWNSLFTSTDWGDSGFYVNQKFMMKGAKISCSNEPIRTQYFYKFGITRSSSGLVSLYLNGYLCATGSPALFSGFTQPSDFTFLRGINHQSSPGWVRAIRIWGKGLSSDEMARASACTLPTASADRCSSVVMASLQYSQMQASSTYGGGSLDASNYYGNPKINSGTAWIAAASDTNQWLQFDMGSKMYVAGVVTQGNNAWWSWVATFQVMVSVDSSTWLPVECGRIFDGNTDLQTPVKNLFDYPVKARYVRIMPLTWYGQIAMRAGVLICEIGCTKQHLDYEFNGDFESSTNGPDLNAPWGAGSFAGSNGYRFPANQGLQLKVGTCLQDMTTYSVSMLVKLDNVDNWRGLMLSPKWQPDGFYVNTNYMLRSQALVCAERIRTSYYYNYGITRDGNGQITLYLNGYPCASGSPAEHSGYTLNPNRTDFLQGVNGQSSAGYVKQIQLWGSALTQQQMADASGCALPAQGAQCQGTVELVIPYERMSASSVWYGYSISSGTGWGQIQLNSPGSWAPASWDQNQWVQFDVGKEEMIAGITTQGSGNYWGYWAYYLMSYWVKVSLDGTTWYNVECGRIFDAAQPSDYSQAYYKKFTNLFASPVKARYVRICPEGWYNGPMMRAALLICEPVCTKNSLEFDLQNSLTSSTGGPSLSTPWGDGAFETLQSNWLQPVSGLVYHFYSTGGGFKLKQSACLTSNEEYTVLMQVQLFNVQPSTWQALLTADGWNSNGLYVTDRLQLRTTSLVCSTQIIQANYFYWYGITRSKDGIVSLFVNGYRCATDSPSQNGGFALKTDDLQFFHGASSTQTGEGRVSYIQLWNSVLSETDIQGITGCTLATAGKTSCSNYMLLYLTDSSYSASSFGSGNSIAMNAYCRSPQPDSQYSWCPGNPSDSWLQIDSGKVQTITGVMTQGYMYGSYWVQTFRVTVSDDGSTWKDVECGRIMIGNTNYLDKLKTIFTSPVEARYVRIHPLTWMNYPMLRASVLVCESACQSGHLDYQMDGFQSSTGGPELTAPWGEGSFSPISSSYDSSISSVIAYLTAQEGYRFTYGQGLKIEESRCISTTADYTILVEAMFDNVNAKRKLMSTGGWNDKGLYIEDQKFGILPATAGLQCPQKVLPGFLYKFGITRTSTNVLKIYMNGNLCASASPLIANGFKLNPRDITFFYDPDTTYSEQGWVRRIQLWDAALSDGELANQCGCKSTTTFMSCSGVPYLSAPPSSSQLAFSSTNKADDGGTGFGQGQSVASSQFRSVQQMRSAGITPPFCPLTSKRIYLQQGSNVKNYFVTQSGTFDEVRAMCQQNGGDLATIKNADDVTAANNVCSDWCYIGIVRDTSLSKWRWVDGSTVQYTNWQNGQPQSGTRVMAHGGAQWSDRGTGDQRAPGLCLAGQDGWASVTGNSLTSTLVFPIGAYSQNGNCDNDANLCTLQFCGPSLSDISSMQIPAGLDVVIYDQNNFMGRYQQYSGGVNVNLGDDGWNHRARSIRIMPKGTLLDRDIGFWTPAPIANQGYNWNLGEWMQVDLGNVSKITGVVTSGFEGRYQAPSDSVLQGSVNPNEYFNWQVTSFMLRVSNDTKSWADVDCGSLYVNQWFNTANAPVTSTLLVPVLARYVRLYPIQWQGGIALRWQVQVCR